LSCERAMDIPERGRLLQLGANIVPGKGVFFRVWAPEADKVSVRVVSGDKKQDIRLGKEEAGYFAGPAEGVCRGDRYVYVLNNTDHYPDPASRFQPEGVHGPSEVVDPDAFLWGDEGWQTIALKEFILYELHVGTFTAEGTFEAIIPHLDSIKELGITAIELMPVAQFPGRRNWGYDGAYPFAPQNNYGGPEGLKRFVNAAHKKGLCVVLDVVYNHLGPEGNYLHLYGPYFTEKYKTPWGAAVNFDGPYSDAVRHFFISNALHWISEYHIDALRLDAVHGILDFGARHFLSELREAVNLQAKRSGKNVVVIAESDLNDVRIINPPDIGGYGLDAQWNDDFHHALHALLTGEQNGYYEDFGKVKHLAKAFSEGFVYSGEYSAFRKRRHGNSSKDCPAVKFVVFSQSHDQVGNRMLGERLSGNQSFDKLKLAAGVVFLSPYIPQIFMGEEYAEIAPFHYFIDHSDDALVRAVREGRKKEFVSFGWEGEPPDPAAADAFDSSRLARDLRAQGKHKILFEFYRELIRLRKEIAALRTLSKEAMEVGSFEEEKVLFVRRWDNGDEVLSLFHFGGDVARVGLMLPEGRWDRILESTSSCWGGDRNYAPEKIDSHGSGVTISCCPHGFVLYRMRGRT
jgi:maltooligosyltrehalose trehalohydrolase